MLKSYAQCKWLVQYMHLWYEPDLNRIYAARAMFTVNNEQRTVMVKIMNANNTLENEIEYNTTQHTHSDRSVYSKNSHDLKKFQFHEQKKMTFLCCEKEEEERTASRKCSNAVNSKSVRCTHITSSPWLPNRISILAVNVHEQRVIHYTYNNINVNVLIITDVFYHRRHTAVSPIFLHSSVSDSVYWCECVCVRACAMHTSACLSFTLCWFVTAHIAICIIIAESLSKQTNKQTNSK